jgi:hypothetical protein
MNTKIGEQKWYTKKDEHVISQAHLVCGLRVMHKIKSHHTTGQRSDCNSNVRAPAAHCSLNQNPLCLYTLQKSTNTPPSSPSAVVSYSLLPLHLLTGVVDEECSNSGVTKLLRNRASAMIHHRCICSFRLSCRTCPRPSSQTACEGHAGVSPS